jgi:hypothetical protein
VAVGKHVAINITMRTVAIYPGRFHVFHKGHKAVYDHLLNQPGVDAVYIATTDKQEPGKSPFNYADKVEMMTKMGVPSSRILKVVNPYKIDEMIKLLGLDPAVDRLIYGLGAKDAERFKYNKESPLQLLSQTKTMKPVGKHAYVEVVPTVPFNVLGKVVTDASVIRQMYLDGNDNDRNQIISDLYGAVDTGLKAMFDQRLGVNTPEQIVKYGAPIVDGGTKEFGENRRIKLKKLSEKIQQLKQQLKEMRQPKNLDYIDEKNRR